MRVLCPICLPGSDLIKSNSVINYYVQMNSAEWTTAPALRTTMSGALQLALNREEIVMALDAGEAYYPLYGYVPKGMAGVNGDFREEVDNAGPYVYYDAEEAKGLLAKAGYGVDNPLNLVYKYNSNNIHDTVAQVMQQQWKQIGVTNRGPQIRTSHSASRTATTSGTCPRLTTWSHNILVHAITSRSKSQWLPCNL